MLQNWQKRWAKVFARIVCDFKKNLFSNVIRVAKSAKNHPLRFEGQPLSAGEGLCNVTKTGQGWGRWGRNASQSGDWKPRLMDPKSSWPSSPELERFWQLSRQQNVFNSCCVSAISTMTHISHYLIQCTYHQITEL